MNAEELRIGDWVDCGKIGTVELISHDNVRINIDGIPTLVSIRRIRPIPLTEEIMAANGYEEESDEYDLQSETLTLSVSPYANGWSVQVSRQGEMDWVMLDDIKHVHELQHLLWAMNFEINFKVN